MAHSIYDQHLDRNAANYAALSPVAFVERSAEVFGDRTAVIHGKRRYRWKETRDRAARLAAALASFGVGRGTTVSAMLHNTPEMVEAHYAVPALNAVLNTLNTRLDHLGRVVQHHADRAAAADAERLQRGREARGAVARLPPAVAPTSVHHRLEIAEHLGAALDEADRRERHEVGPGLLEVLVVDAVHDVSQGLGISPNAAYPALRDKA